jgi:hypothetical protein
MGFMEVEGCGTESMLIKRAAITAPASTAPIRGRRRAHDRADNPSRINGIFISFLDSQNICLNAGPSLILKVVPSGFHSGQDY